MVHTCRAIPPAITLTLNDCAKCGHRHKLDNRSAHWGRIITRCWLCKCRKYVEPDSARGKRMKASEEAT